MRVTSLDRGQAEPPTPATVKGSMTNPLQTKDDQWRHRGNAAQPVFDAGLAPLGTDEEAGGAHAPPSSPREGHAPMSPEPAPERPGPKLPPMFWIMVAAAALAVIVAAAAISF